jgi:hypothetical protein
MDRRCAISAKRHEGPALVVADRIDAIQAWLKREDSEINFTRAIRDGAGALRGGDSTRRLS